MPPSFSGGLSEPSPGPFRATPPVYKWYVAYCIAMAVLYVIVAVMGGILLTMDPVRSGQDAATVKVQATIMIAIGIPLIFIFGCAPFLPKKPWAWITGIVLLALGMTSCCCLPAAIPLLIFWLKPECREFFA